MKIAIDARFYGEAGPGRYVKNLVNYLVKQDLDNNYIIFLNQSGFDSFKSQNKNVKKVLVNCSWYSFKEQFVMLWAVLKERPDVYHVPHFNIPVLYSGKLVVTIHDLIIHQFSTEKATTRNLWYYKFKRQVYRLVFGLACNRASSIIVPSKAVKNELVKEYSWLNPDKVVVTYEGVDTAFDTEKHPHTKTLTDEVLSKYSITQPYLLYVSSFYPHKNVDLLLNGLKVLKEKYSFEGKLVCVGKQDFFAKRLQTKVVELGLEDSVTFPGKVVSSGYVKDSDLAILFQNASLYVFPSLKEGFSLTPLEAMVSGVPVITSNIFVHREVLGSAAIFFDPYSPDEFAKKVNQILKNFELQKDLIEKGKKKVREYSWEKMVEETLEVYKRLGF